MKVVIKNALLAIMLVSIGVFVANVIRYRLIDVNNTITNYSDLVAQKASLPFLIAIVSGMLLFVFSKWNPPKKGV